MWNGTALHKFSGELCVGEDRGSESGKLAGGFYILKGYAVRNLHAVLLAVVEVLTPRVKCPVTL